MKELLEQYITSNISDDDRRKVVEWLHESEDNMRQYEKLQKLYSILIWNEADIEEEEIRNPKRAIIRNLMKVAAIFAFVICASASIFYLFDLRITSTPKITMQNIYVPSGQRAEITLADGTHVWLNANTKFNFPNSFSDSLRVIELDGEARFKVEPNTKSPFVVKTKLHDIRVLGTEFNVLAYDTDSVFETALMEGKVRVNNQKGETCILSPNTKLRSINGGQMTTQEFDNSDIYRWVEGLMCFEDESVDNLLHKIEFYFNVKVIINNQTLKDRKYTGKFWVDDGVEHILKVLQISTDFTYKRNIETNEIEIN